MGKVNESNYYRIIIRHDVYRVLHVLIKVECVYISQITFSTNEDLIFEFLSLLLTLY